MMETIHNEWHRSPENKAILEELIWAVFKPKQVLIAHHLCYTTQDGEDKEIASAETLLFNHEFLKILFGDQWQEMGAVLLAIAPDERIQWFKGKDIEAMWQEGVARYEGSTPALDDATARGG